MRKPKNRPSSPKLYIPPKPKPGDAVHRRKGEFGEMTTKRVRDSFGHIVKEAIMSRMELINTMVLMHVQDNSGAGPVLKFDFRIELEKHPKGTVMSISMLPDDVEHELALH